MAKRYYNSKMSEGYYAGMDARRKQEKMDGSMISEDMSAVANMPQEVVMREYPKAAYSYGPELNDTMRGIDVQISDDMKGGKKGSFPEKY